jgi:hypothetical protein
MINITTKQIGNTWYCSVTHAGYDVLESSDTLQEAQRLMRNRMVSANINPTELVFTDPVFYTKPERIPKPTIGYNSCKIDNL